MNETKSFLIGHAIGRLSFSERSPRIVLTVVEPSFVEDGVFVPAESVTIYDQGVVNLARELQCILEADKAGGKP